MRFLLSTKKHRLRRGRRLRHLRRRRNETLIPPSTVRRPPSSLRVQNRRSGHATSDSNIDPRRRICDNLLGRWGKGGHEIRSPSRTSTCGPLGERKREKYLEKRTGVQIGDSSNSIQWESGIAWQAKRATVSASDRSLHDSSTCEFFFSGFASERWEPKAAIGCTTMRL